MLSLARTSDVGLKFATGWLWGQWANDNAKPPFLYWLYRPVVKEMSWEPLPR